MKKIIKTIYIILLFSLIFLFEYLSIRLMVLNTESFFNYLLNIFCIASITFLLFYFVFKIIPIKGLLNYKIKDLINILIILILILILLFDKVLIKKNYLFEYFIDFFIITISTIALLGSSIDLTKRKCFIFYVILWGCSRFLWLSIFMKLSIKYFVQLFKTC